MATTRAFAPHFPTWQRFHEFAAPLASSSGAGAASNNGSGSGSGHPYGRQYSHVYSARLALLRERCLSKARQELAGMGVKKEDVNVAERIIEVNEGTWSVLVGTIVKEVDAKRRPKVETSYNEAGDAQSFLFPTKDGEKVGQESLRSHLFDMEKGDVLHLEDESGRVELAPEEEDGACETNDNKNAFDADKVATGVVAAVVGKVCSAKGIMRVHSIHFAGPPSPSSDNDTSCASNAELRGPTKDEQTDEEPTLLLVSGLGCGADSPQDAESGASLALRREMLLEYLTDPALDNGASVCRVIVAGGGVSPMPTPAKEEDKENSKLGKKGYNNVASGKGKGKGVSPEANHLAFSLKELDLYLSELLASGVPVDYVPGWHDPTNANWPQRPLHSCLLPLSCGYVDLFGRGTNPYEGLLGGDEKKGGVRVLGTDGLNIADLRRFLAKKKEGASKEEKDGDEKEEKGEEDAVAVSNIDALNQTLKYGHVAPTGPDSLPTFPSAESDPFVLNSRPRVYFAGNCESFETRLVDADCNEVNEDGFDGDGKANMTRLVCVPSFALTGEAVLVKLRSLECKVVSFNDVSL